MLAHNVQPQHRPHEQLRTEPPAHREHSDKYVSSFVSGDREVDMNFKNPLLSKSADHYKVGIDELTINLSALSLLEYTEDEVVFRIIRRGYQIPGLAAEVVENQDDMSDFQMPNGPAGYESKWRDAFEFKVIRPYNTMLEVLERCTEIANAVGTYIRSQGLTNNAGQYWTIPWAVIPENAALQHFQIKLTSNGQLRFSGNKVFWANFSVEVPFEKYRQIIFRDPDKRFVSIDPFTGAEIADPYAADGALGFNTHVFVDLDVNAYGDASNIREHEFSGNGNLLASLDRRVTLEVGCSLPIKNSPMIDHGEEAPDFVLGRYMFHQPYTMKSYYNDVLPELLVPGLGTRTMQGPKDRIVYHHLQPQQKIQMLRLRLWARVRSYNTNTKKWGMKTILCPMEDIDYWHIRLHITEK
jgi:hypothetical protein